MSQLNRQTLFALAAVPLTAGLVLAASGSGTPPAQSAQPEQSQSSQAQPGTPRTPATPPGTRSSDVFVQKLAATLGVSVERLRAAAVQAGNATIDQAVEAGDLSGERAARMKERLQNAPLNFGSGRGGSGGHDHGGRGFGRGSGQHHGERGGFGPGGQDQGSAPAPEDTGATGLGT
ncbi:hypothetical protein QOL99_15675 [Deinococcus sp. MIMF12]|uniref:DUF2680 domain-containing protein n=1 Tax=Deinococcus rhizophilus TaxID=3049544 RepID=A0ABT7JKK4_9DEIO|nr:hypothetical protein [Deinococcus rhizophilus]MDL2345576.1 hypothetical protein [Deinococcus rhizophilus]